MNHTGHTPGHNGHTIDHCRPISAFYFQKKSKKIQLFFKTLFYSNSCNYAIQKIEEKIERIILDKNYSRSYVTRDHSYFIL